LDNSKTLKTAALEKVDKEADPTHLLRLKVTDDGIDAVQYLINERHNFPDLNLHEVTPTLLCYFDECVARHVLNTIVRFCTNPWHTSISFCLNRKAVRLTDKCFKSC